MLDELYDIWYVPLWDRIGMLHIALGISLIAIIILLFVLRIWLINRAYWFEARKKIKILIEKQHAVMRPRDLYAQIMLILKKYIEARFDIPATRLTEYELLFSLKKINTDRTQELLSPLIMHAENIKFGGFAGDSQVIHADLANLLLFIELSKPKTIERARSKATQHDI